LRVGVRQLAGDRARRNVRQVRDERDGRVVTLGVEADRIGTTVASQPLNQVDPKTVRRICGADRPGSGVEEVGLGGRASSPLAPRHRMAANKASLNT
jgi:hypothetical protein